MYFVKTPFLDLQHLQEKSLFRWKNFIAKNVRLFDDLIANHEVSFYVKWMKPFLSEQGRPDPPPPTLCFTGL